MSQDDDVEFPEELSDPEADLSPEEALSADTDAGHEAASEELSTTDLPPRGDASNEIILEEIFASRVVGGVPTLDRADLPETPWEDGALKHLLNPRQELIGYGVVDAREKLLRVWPGDREHLNNEFFRRRVFLAADWRQRLGLMTPDSAYRLINGEGDGLSGLVVDVYGRHVIIYGYSAGLLPFAKEVARAIEERLAPESILFKVRDAGDTATGKIPFEVLSGSEPPARLVVKENGLNFEVHLTSGLNTGLFSDMRLVRETIAPWCQGRRVLNTFAYTGSFSVLAAKNHAKSVTTVDFAGGVLNWTRANFALNDLAAEHHRFRFLRADVFDFLKTANRKDQEYDLIILDPPASTQVPGRRWYLKSDYDRLIAHALKLAAKNAILVVAASSLQSRPEGVESQIRAAGKQAQRRLRLIASPGLPPDFPTQMIHAPGRYLKCSILLVE